MRLETISEDHDISDAVAALGALHKADAERKHVMGLLYFDGEKPSLDADLLTFTTLQLSRWAKIFSDHLVNNWIR